MSHQILARYEKGMIFNAAIDEYSIKMDSTDETSSHAGPSPKKLLLASLAGCTGIDIVSILQKMRVSFSDFTIEVSANLTEEHPKIYKDVQIIYSINVAANDKDKMEKAVQLSKEKYCGVSAMFSKFSEVEFKILYR
jgi:putative redox protein